jgi:hypothetical protein
MWDRKMLIEASSLIFLSGIFLLVVRFNLIEACAYFGACGVRRLDAAFAFTTRHFR